MQEENKNNKSEAALREEKILEFWKENQIFEKSEKQREGKKEFVFYEGPPTANGNPGIHHLEARAFKDAIPRYKSMRGYHLRRKGGWDTHGLPVELQVEKKLGLNSKKAIEEYGVAKFNQECKKNVWELLDKWTHFTERMGYWTDLKNPYVTYHNEYIESIWNIVKEVNEKKLLYKDYKVVPWCPRCGTALSSHELAQGYEDVKDLSLYVKFKVIGQENTYILAWTTTPWTLPGNVGLAVGEDIDYVKVKNVNEIYVVAKERISVLGENLEILGEVKGKELVGLACEPLFPYLKDQVEAKGESTEKAFKVYGADFVTTTDGTGIVHTAVMYGQDDFVLGTKVGLPKHHLVNLEGKFVPGTDFLEGRFVKEKDENGKPTLDVDIINYLTAKNLFFKKENYTHSYPHCWRCKTALIYYARDSWYIRMSDPRVKEKLISENKNINWEPSHIRDGRFGEWLREIKDWAISRERYWGTPLPVWQCNTCQKIEVVGGIETLKAKTKKSGNKYFVMRHGGSVSNMKNVASLVPGEENDALTDQGREQVRQEAKKITEKIDIIISSNFTRTLQTAEIVAEVLSISKDQIIIEKELRESRAVQSGKETKSDVMERMIHVMQELEKNYFGKNILIVSHEDPIRVLLSGHDSLGGNEEVNDFNINYPRIQNAEVNKCNFLSLPRNSRGQIDLHKPYIDEVRLACECGGDMSRTKEVMDVWFDSGAMPFAQDHYPFENKKFVDGPGFPADYISEAIDQTRGWFYTLHAIGVLMGRGRAFKNAICLGHLLDANGKKMSKSLGNVVDPWIMMDKYGVDTLRMWMYSVNQPGESKNFDEKTVALLNQQVFTLLYNVLAFYELYRDKSVEEVFDHYSGAASSQTLDRWIFARLDDLIFESQNHLDNYRLLEPVRAVRDFIGDLSTWYLRRSRERIKSGDQDAKRTLYIVLKTLAKVIAPFAPFAAEDIWQRLKAPDIEVPKFFFKGTTIQQGDVESVHLADWPMGGGSGREVDLKKMKLTREIVSFGLEARQKAKLPVKQALSTLKYKVESGELEKEYLELIKDELNVKEVIFDKNIGAEVELDIEITDELRQEGNYRELVRALQDLRKKTGLTPSDVVVLQVETSEAGRALVEKFMEDMKRVVLLSKVEFAGNDGDVVKLGDLEFKVQIKK